jgi:hypothetical protein
MKTKPIMDTAASLLGVALLIVTAVHITGKASKSIADELSFAAAMLFLCSCLVSHRGYTREKDRLERIADGLFDVGILTLLAGVLSFWF